MSGVVLVTGAGGFLGKHLVARLLRDNLHMVLAQDLPAPLEGLGTMKDEVVLERADITDVGQMKDLAKQMADLEVDTVVHLAAIAAPRAVEANPTLGWEVNVRGTHNVLEACRHAGVGKVVFMSSAHVYGISPPYMPTPEVCPLFPQEAYTSTKLLGERLCEMYWTTYGVAHVTLRLYNSFGPGQSTEYFLGRTIERAKKGPFTLRGGSVTKDWVYVDDTVDAIVRAMGTGFVGPINVGTGREASLRVLATLIADHYKVAFTDEPDDGLGPTRMCADWSRARKVLGWEPKVVVEEGLRRTLEAVDQ